MTPFEHLATKALEDAEFLAELRDNPSSALAKVGIHDARAAEDVRHALSVLEKSHIDAIRRIRDRGMKAAN